jgi:hypothetical protein
VTNDGGPPDSESEPFGSLPEGPDDAADADRDAADAGEPGQQTALPPKVEAWRRRSATGAVLTGFALGLQQALGKEQEQPAIIMQTSGDPPTDLPVDAEVEQGRPRQSVVNIRPWLLPNRTEEPNYPEETGQDAGGSRPGPDPGTEDS